MGEFENAPPGVNTDQFSGYPPLFEVRRGISLSESEDQVFDWIAKNIKPRDQVFILLRCDYQQAKMVSCHDPRLTIPLSPPRLILPALKELEIHLADNPLVTVSTSPPDSPAARLLADIPSQINCEAVALASVTQNQTNKALFVVGAYQREASSKYLSESTLQHIGALAQITSLFLESLETRITLKKYEAMFQLLDTENIQVNSEYERFASEISSKLWSSMDIDTLLKTTLRELGRTLQASQGFIQLETFPPEE